jgi:hypothetical protein
MRFIPYFSNNLFVLFIMKMQATLDATRNLYGIGEPDGEGSSVRIRWYNESGSGEEVSVRATSEYREASLKYVSELVRPKSHG